MHPAYSVIIFTTFSGAGYGLAAFLGLGLNDPTLLTAKVGYFLALGLISIGLLSSTLHLGNPKNAIRAFSQWRSSWLSREGVLAIITFIPLTILGFTNIFLDMHIGWIGYISIILSMLTVYSTSMIYGSLRTINLWYTWLTPVTYLLFSIASGAVLLTALTAFFEGSAGELPKIAIIALVAAWIAKWFWNRRQDQGYGGSTMETATGLGHLGKVRLLERPHAMENYLTREMGFRVARKHANLLWAIALQTGLIIPAVLLALSFGLQTSTMAVLLAIVAAIFHMIGMLVERWLFFANAKHAVSLYYGDTALEAG